MSLISRKIITPGSTDGLADRREDDLILVCEARKPEGQSIADLCRALGARAETVTEGEGLLVMLHYMQPVAIISEVVLDDQDGFNVMKGVAAYNRDLPMLMITGGDPVLHGAVEAIEEVWGMTQLSILDAAPSEVTVGHFLQSAGMRTTSRAHALFRADSRIGRARPDFL